MCIQIFGKYIFIRFPDLNNIDIIPYYFVKKIKAKRNI